MKASHRQSLFALLRPKSELCTLYHIGQKMTFYLPMYRDGTTNLKGRGPAWNRLVLKQTLRPSEAKLCEKQIAYKKARNTTKIMRKFVDYEDKSKRDDAGLMAKELLQVWPEFDTIGAEDLTVPKEQLTRDNIANQAISTVRRVWVPPKRSYQF